MANNIPAAVSGCSQMLTYKPAEAYPAWKCGNLYKLSSSACAKLAYDPDKVYLAAAPCAASKLGNDLNCGPSAALQLGHALNYSYNYKWPLRLSPPGAVR